MNQRQKDIEGQLSGRLLADWCAQKANERKDFFHQHGYDSGSRVIRFMTERTRSLFSLKNETDGYWKNGSAVMYQIYNQPEHIELRCTTSPIDLKKRERALFEQLVQGCHAEQCGKELYTLAKWPIVGQTINEALEALDSVFEIDVMWFESELALWQKEPDRIIRAFPQCEHLLIKNTDLPEEIYIEGAQKQILSNRYERNPKARARCIALKGTACAVCGFDFGRVYGEEFAGKIEVHHITPISEIGEAYVVDPARDLVPVCPNCHMMLHSKAEGVYTVDELKNIMNGK